MAGTSATWPEARFYSITAMIVPPVFIGFSALIAVSSLSASSSRAVGIGATVVAVLMAAFWVQRPYVAVAGSDGSVVFKALLVTRRTTVAQIDRVRLTTGTRGGSTWRFQFSGTEAALGDIGGRDLARYVIERNPRVQYPVHRFP